MNRDILLATAIGFIIGLILTGVILLGPKALASLPKLKGISFSFPSFSFPKGPEKLSPTPAQNQNPGFVIQAPLSEAIESGESVLISGTAHAGATVSASGQLDEDIVVVKEDGKLALKVGLVEGKNEISVSEFFENKQITQTIVVYRSIDSF
ncbi:hypothetical protein HY947_01640 [Candidatus Gottesmanbacteria bacterium]|nr:hypothetical protein [Candidatus Gottesmanbacteria bacterium]